MAGTDAAICARGWAMRARRGMKADGDACGYGPERGDEQRGIHAQEGGARALEQLNDLRTMQLTQEQHGMEGSKNGCDEKHDEDTAVGDERTLAGSGAALRLCESAETSRGKIVVDAFSQRHNRLLMQPADGVGVAQGIEDG